MCFRKQIPEEYLPADFRIISNGRNKYSGGNSLRGCVNDTIFMPQPLEKVIPMDVRRYYDYDVTVNKYLDRAERAIATLSPGATVAIVADSCFSGTITRGNMAAAMGFVENPPIRNRYFPNPKVTPGMTRRSRVFESIEDRCLLISGCQEGQTSADAYIAKYDRYMGALSFALAETFQKEMTWEEWVYEASRLIARSGFDQRPNFLGKESKKKEIIGSSQTLMLHNSSHGSRMADTSGDEADGYDETIYFDTHLTDDRISLFLDKIPA